MEASTPSHASGGQTSVTPSVFSGFAKSTNPQFNVLTWLHNVPIGSTVKTSIHERVESRSGGQDVTYCHGTAKNSPWSWGLDVKESLANARGRWMDLPPQTKIQNDRGPVMSVTCKIMTEGVESGGQGVQLGGGVAFGGQDAQGPGVAWQAMQPSAPPESVASGGQDVEGPVEPPVMDVPITSEDGFTQRPVDSPTCRFYIPRAVMEQLPPNLWADDVKTTPRCQQVWYKPRSRTTTPWPSVGTGKP